MDSLSARNTAETDDAERYGSYRAGQMRDGMLSYTLWEALGVADLSEFFAEMGDTPFSFCGLPLLPDGISVRGDITAAVMKNAGCPDGAEAFLSFLYSERIQTCKAMLSVGFPVTKQALYAVMPIGYNDYRTDPNGELTYVKHSTVPASEIEMRNVYDAEIYLSEEQCRRWLDAVSNASLYRAGGDKTILSIIEEELSASDAGVRSRAEAAKIIQSRVMLYLNE